MANLEAEHRRWAWGSLLSRPYRRRGRLLDVGTPRERRYVSGMKKTPIAAPYSRRLNDINDQLCFGALGAEEISRVTATVAALPSGATTVTLFPGNSHASRIHRKAEDLPAFERGAVNTACLSALIAGSEFMQAYCEAALSAARQLTGLPATNGGGGREERLQAQLAAWGSPIAGGIVDTVTYLRRRRNCLVHADGALSLDLSTWFAAGPVPPGGPSALATFWSGRPVDLMGFDFADQAIDEFRVEDGYAIMNLFRICLVEIDAVVASVLPVGSVVAMEAQQLVARAPHLKGDWDRLTKKVGGILELNYGAGHNTAALRPMVRLAFP